MASSRGAGKQPSLHKVRGGYKQLSQRALSAVLEEIHEHGIPKATSRSSIKRSKELEVDVDTPFGKLFVGKTLKLAEKFKSHLSWEFHFINPLALLHHMAINCAEFSLLFSDCLEKQAPSHERPLSIACYADEVTPGNPLAHRNSRKFQVSYWSIASLGAAALSCERLWFPLFVARSEVVKKLPGRMAQLVKEALLLFQEPWDLRAGQVFTVGDQRKMVFAHVRIHISDEAALKETFEFRGAAGTRLCPLCLNLVEHKKDLCSYDATGSLVPATCLDKTLIKRTSARSIRTALDHLDAQKGVVSKTAFEKLQQYCGWSYNPESPLKCEKLGIDLPAVLMFDWMHTYCAGGLWGIEAHLLIETLQKARLLSQQQIHEAVQEFVWPCAVQGRSASGIKQVFGKEHTNSISLSALEALSLYSVLRFLVVQKLELGGLPDDLRKCVDSYLKLCRVLDLLQDTRRGRTQASELETAIFSHLEAFLGAYGDSRWIPKHHYASHLSQMLLQFGVLCSCWRLERKRKEFKRWADLAEFTPSSWERGILRDAIAPQLQDLKKNEVDPFLVRICNPEEPGRNLKALLQMHFDEEEISVSEKACFLPGATAHRHDVVLFAMDEEKGVGQIQMFAKIGLANYACLHLWCEQFHNEIKACHGAA